MTTPPAIFDMDGTLIDSVKVVTETFDKTMRDLAGVEHPLDYYRRFIGPPLEETFAQLGADDVQHYIAEYRARYKKRHLEVPLFPGIEEMLSCLHSHDVPMVIATSKEQTNAQILAEHLGISHFFVKICGANEKTGHTKKEMIVADAMVALREKGIAPEEAVMVGDRKFDVIGAKKHGLRTILVGWGPTPEEEYEMAWKVGNEPMDVARLLLENSRV